VAWKRGIALTKYTIEPFDMDWILAKLLSYREYFLHSIPPSLHQSPDQVQGDYGILKGRRSTRTIVHNDKCSFNLQNMTIFCIHFDAQSKYTGLR
jgi:hypothetical protein